MSPARRALLAALGLAPWLRVRAAAEPEPWTQRALALPADFGAHPARRIEWWYVTGALDAAGGRGYGFQVTFFRSRTEVPADNASRFAATQLVFAHAAVTDLARARLRHDQRLARAGFGIAEAATGTTALRLRDWTLARAADGGYRTAVRSDTGFAFELALAPTQPPLAQGEAGWSRKGPAPQEASLYYSEPQLRVAGRLALDGKSQEVSGRAWLDHEWSDALLPRGAVGWDWLGMNLDDGAALTAFRLRRADGSALWAGGSLRPRDGAARAFGPDEVRFEPLRWWRSPLSPARYPVAWRVVTPAGTHEVRALLDAQELDSRASAGAIYWEGLSELLDAEGRRIGRGYLEMTGYAAPLGLG